MEKKFRRIAAEQGLSFCGPEKIYNTRKAQEMGAWAASLNRGDEFHHAVYVAHFGEGKNISDRKVLCELAESVGLPPDEAMRSLGNRSFKSAVDADWQLSKQVNIMVIPTYLINGNRLVGVQSFVKLSRFLENNGVGKRSA
jgi:predicted DsbA family dithiol-disulfide isomerase